MANVTGLSALNLHSTKQSYLILTDPDSPGRFNKDTTKLTSPVPDKQHSDTSFDGKILWNLSSANRLVIRLTGKVTKRDKDGTPTSGSLTVTLTNGSTPIPTDDTPVQYLNDDGSL
jgi:hypothetical protein